MRWGLELDLDLDTGRKLKAHQSLDRLGRGVGDVDQTLVGAALELLTAVLIFVDGAQNGDDLFLGGQRDGAGDSRAGALGGLDDLLCALVDDLMVLRLETNADHFFCPFLVSPSFCTVFLHCRSRTVRAFAVRLSVRIIPAHGKTGSNKRPVHTWRSDLRNVQILSLSRPMFGHTPRKLPQNA